MNEVELTILNQKDMQDQLNQALNIALIDVDPDYSCNMDYFHFQKQLQQRFARTFGIDGKYFKGKDNDS